MTDQFHLHQCIRMILFNNSICWLDIGIESDLFSPFLSEVVQNCWCLTRSMCCYSVQTKAELLWLQLISEHIFLRRCVFQCAQHRYGNSLKYRWKWCSIRKPHLYVQQCSDLFVCLHLDTCANKIVHELIMKCGMNVLKWKLHECSVVCLIVEHKWWILDFFTCQGLIAHGNPKQWNVDEHWPLLETMMKCNLIFFSLKRYVYS